MSLNDASQHKRNNPRRPAAPTRRECFVTVGATASFKGLIKAVMAPAFLTKLTELGYTRLVIQCGPDLLLFEELKESLDLKGLDVTAFDFNKTGLGQEMRECKANAGLSKMGVIISHAGKQTTSTKNAIGGFKTMCQIMLVWFYLGCYENRFAHYRGSKSGAVG